MLRRFAILTMYVGVIVTTMASVAVAYIHFPPMTLQKMCKESHHIRVLKVEKFDKDKGVVVFENAESLQKQIVAIPTFKHVLRIDAEGTKPILEWFAKGKTAVMFSIEAKTHGIGYVFIDDYCYSADYNSDSKCWILIRAEPTMSACYFGSTEKLRTTIKDILDGKEVKVSVKVPDAKVDHDRRYKEINVILDKIRAEEKK